MPPFQLALLGPPLLRIAGQPVTVRSRKPLALLAYLAVSGQSVGRDSLAALLWPDHDQTSSRAYLRNALWVLSKAGLEEWLALDGDAISLRPGFELDVAELRRLADETRQHTHPAEAACPDCLARLRAAADLYRDSFLAGFTLRDSPEFDDWQSFQAELLRQEFARVLERLVALVERAADGEAGIGYARRWVAVNSLNEAAHRGLMRLYAQTGKRALALKQYETLAQVLDEELGAEPDATSRQLFAEISAGRFQGVAAVEIPPAGAPAAAAAPRPPHNLPAQLTCFVGRQRDMAQLQALLEDENRLLTLIGPGGSGKTRLALEAAAGLLDRFQDGVFFVNLAAVDREDLVPSAMASALGMFEAPGRPLVDLLKEQLRDRQLLLVLDNFEHLMGAAALVADLLAVAPRLTVLVTSREVLRLYGEQVYDLPPLELPSLDPPAPYADLLENEAVQLFVQRARAVQPSFELNEQNAPLVAEICVRLDGLPLAIELAAARTGLFSLAQLCAQLHQQPGDRLKVLRGGPRNAHARQRTLSGMIDWSYNLLHPAEQQLFARLAIFFSSFSLQAVEQVCLSGLDLEAAEGLELLLQKSSYAGRPACRANRVLPCLKPSAPMPSRSWKHSARSKRCARGTPAASWNWSSGRSRT